MPCKRQQPQNGKAKVCFRGVAKMYLRKQKYVKRQRKYKMYRKVFCFVSGKRTTAEVKGVCKEART
jgi:predicted PolB exonuclease-like 3'-5' exonuclease